MSSTTTNRCKICRFWREDTRHTDEDDADWAFGDCRRLPPRVVETAAKAVLPRAEYSQQVEPEVGTVSRQSASWFPATFATDWCGEFELACQQVPA